MIGRINAILQSSSSISGLAQGELKWQGKAVRFPDEVNRILQNDPSGQVLSNQELLERVCQLCGRPVDESVLKETDRLPGYLATMLIERYGNGPTDEGYVSSDSLNSLEVSEKGELENQGCSLSGQEELAGQARKLGALNVIPEIMNKLRQGEYIPLKNPGETGADKNKDDWNKLPSEVFDSIFDGVCRWAESVRDAKLGAKHSSRVDEGCYSFGGIHGRTSSQVAPELAADALVKLTTRKHAMLLLRSRMEELDLRREALLKGPPDAPHSRRIRAERWRIDQTFDNLERICLSLDRMDEDWPLVAEQKEKEKVDVFLNELMSVLKDQSKAELESLVLQSRMTGSYVFKRKKIRVRTFKFDLELISKINELEVSGVFPFRNGVSVRKSEEYLTDVLNMVSEGLNNFGLSFEEHYKVVKKLAEMMGADELRSMMGKSGTGKYAKYFQGVLEIYCKDTDKGVNLLTDGKPVSWTAEERELAIKKVKQYKNL